VKHGNRAASSQCGSADVLEALGVPIELGPAGVERCVAEVGVGFCLAQRYHPALRFMGPARAALGVPTTFNFLGPLANPARVRRQAVGVSDAAMAERVIAVLQANGAEHVWVFYGDDGLDELTTTTTSTVFELRDGEIRRFTLDPAAAGFARANAADLVGSDATANADVVRAVLDGKPGAARDIALVNAAAALVVGGIADDFADGVQRARAAVDDGAAARVLEDWLRVGGEARAAEAR
jgi:anthranilate phosphoribosyltransferase